MHRTFLCILLISNLFAYRAHSQNTTISGHLMGIGDGKYFYITAYPLDHSVQYKDSAKITNGGFSFNMSIPEGKGSLYYISSVPMRLKEEGEPIDPVRYSHRWKLIYLQQGNAVVEGDANYLDKAIFSGDLYMQEENDYFTWQHTNKAWERFVNNMDEEYARGENVNGSRPLKNDSADKAMMLGVYMRVLIAEAWVRDHPNSPYSAVVVYKDISKFFDEGHEEKTKYFHLLTPAAKDNAVGKFLADWLH